jgi:hypothetical protein
MVCASDFGVVQPNQENRPMQVTLSGRRFELALSGGSIFAATPRHEIHVFAAKRSGREPRFWSMKTRDGAETRLGPIKLVWSRA